MRTADLARRVEVAEQRMDTMEERLDASYSALSTQILQSRRESKDALLATRDELRGEIAATRDDLRGEIAATRDEMQAGFARLERMLADGLDETRRFMKVLYEDILSRIALLAEHRPTS
jgi:predicted  nucleic acid-binding Zn-ribbon protein